MHATLCLFILFALDYITHYYTRQKLFEPLAIYTFIGIHWETAQSVKDVQEGGGYTDSDTGVAEGKIGRKKTRREGRRTTNLGPSCRCWGWRGRWLVRWRRGVRWGVEPGN